MVVLSQESGRGAFGLAQIGAKALLQTKTFWSRSAERSSIALLSGHDITRTYGCPKCGRIESGRGAVGLATYRSQEEKELEK